MIANLRVKEIVLSAGLDAVGVTSTQRSGALCVISAAACYLTSEPADATTPGRPHGTVARYTWRNYYRDTRAKLQDAAKVLRSEFGMETHCHCCAAPGRLAEKSIASQAGVGYYGKNGIILTEKFGSWVVLGEIETDLAIEPDAPLEKDCGLCTACMDACPTQALAEPYVLNTERCLQYLMNWRGILPVPIRELWGNRLYGCTTCQDVCPKNKTVAPTERRFKTGFVGCSLPLLEVLGMDEPTFRARFQGNQLGARWIDRDCIRRNAAVALGNLGDPAAIPALEKSLTDPSEMVRVHTAWALEKLACT